MKNKTKQRVNPNMMNRVLGHIGAAHIPAQKILKYFCDILSDIH
jgi:hypothetical protein